MAVSHLLDVHGGRMSVEEERATTTREKSRWVYRPQW